MKNSPIPANENERLAALKKHYLLDTLNEEEFDRLTQLASLICDTPIALISIIDKDRQWFKSRVGMDVSEIARDISICQFTIMGDDILEITDASMDENIKDSSLVTGTPNIRFYAGYPLKDSKGYNLGTLCVIDRKPKKLTETQKMALEMIAKEVISKIISRKRRMQAEKFRKMFDLSHNLISFIGTDGLFKKTNPAFTKLLEWSKVELFGSSVYNYIHPEDLQRSQELFESIVSGTKLPSFNIRMRKKGGEYLTLNWTANIDSTTGEIFAIARDISEEEIKKIENARLLEFQHNILNGTDKAIISTTPEGIITLFNKGAEEMLGYTTAELVHKSTPAIFYKDSEVINRAIELSKELNTTIEPGFDVYIVKARLGLPDKHEWTFIRKDGTQLTVEQSVTTLRDNGNEITGFLGIARDITALNKSQAETVQLRNALYQTAIIAVTDATGKIKSVNDKFCEISKYSEHELLGKNHRITNSGYHPTEFFKELWTTIMSGEIWRGEVKNKDKNGNFYWTDTTIVPFLNGEIKPVEYVTIRHDITERKRVEEELKEAKRNADKAIGAKDEFLANMSHEIRTPLNAIIGFNDLLRSTTLSPVQKKHVEIVSMASQNLMVIINDVLDTSKLESGMIQLESREMSLKKIAEQAIKLQSNKAREKGLKLISSIDQDIPDSVLGDETRIIQILVNLINNAIKFTHEGLVELKIIEIMGDEKYSTIKFIVKDSGIGIPEDKQQAIFERFTQAESSTTRIYGGTGLGLNIVKMLVAMHKGKLELNSKPGKGSEFSFEITFEIDHQINDASDIIEMESVQQAIHKNLKGVKILIVEDNEFNQVLVNTYLKRNMAITDLAEDGVIAIEKIKQNNYDIILMDLQMPNMDGFRATDIIRNELKLELPILACSAHSLVGEKANCIEKGMTDYISKPYTEKVLISVIGKYIMR